VSTIPYTSVMARVMAARERVDTRALDPADAAARLFDQVRQCDWLAKPWRRGVPQNTCFSGTPEMFDLARQWSRSSAPAHSAQLFA
jgi:hypothetical protein